MINEIFQSLILGLVQGLGEFLPISSTAHLVLVPYFFHWEDPGLTFDVALHAGTLIAVVGYFWKDWIVIIKQAFNNGMKNENIKMKNYGNNFLWLLVIATIPGILVGYFFEDKAEAVLRSPLLIAFSLSFVGLILYLADRFLQHRKNIQEINFVDAILIGLAQAVAIIPGVSRSGATISAGLGRGLSRVEAAKFSFLLSTPIIFGATVLKFKYLIQDFSLPLVVGILASAISGFLAIKYLIKFVEKSSYVVFFWYRLVLAGVILVAYFLNLK